MNLEGDFVPNTNDFKTENAVVPDGLLTSFFSIEGLISVSTSLVGVDVPDDPFLRLIALLLDGDSLSESIFIICLFNSSIPFSFFITTALDSVIVGVDSNNDINKG